MQGGARKRDIVPILHSFAAMNPPGMKVLIVAQAGGGRSRPGESRQDKSLGGGGQTSLTWIHIRQNSELCKSIGILPF